MKKGFVCGVFDLLHYGHILMLEECKQNCDYLALALNKAENIDAKINPNKQPPIFTYEQREHVISHCDLVDEILPYSTEDELMGLMEIGGYEVRFLGDDYKGKPITGSDLIPEIHWIDRSHGWSTSFIKSRL